MTEAKRSFGPETERVVNGRVFKVTEIPPEDPEEVKRRDHVNDNISGRKTMVEAATGRIAPKFTPEYEYSPKRYN